MHTHAIVELEEGTLSVVVGERDGATTRVVRSERAPLPDLDRERVAAALRTAAGGALHRTAGAHVVLGERRMQHFVSTLPPMAARDVLGFVTREALRLTNAPSAADLLLTTRFLRRLPDGRLQLATTALARGVFEPIAAAFEHAGLRVLGLHSTENCLASATLASFREPVAVLECNAGRARFVLCQDQAPLQVRRFLVGGGDVNASALLTQLVMELPRTLDWLRETGQPLPHWLLLGTRVPVDEESLDMLRGDALQQISRAVPPFDLDPGIPSPSLGAATLLDLVARGISLPSLLAPPRLRLPLGARWLTAALCGAAAGVVCAALAVVDGAAWLATKPERERLERDRTALERSIAAAGAGPIAAAAAAATAGDRQLDQALSMRRPISRLIAEVSNGAGAGVQLDELRFASIDRVVVAGAAEGASRREALAALARFTERLRALPYVVADGQEEIAEVAGQWNRLRFRLGMAWRNE